MYSFFSTTDARLICLATTVGKLIPQNYCRRDVAFSSTHPVMFSHVLMGPTNPPPSMTPLCKDPFRPVLADNLFALLPEVKLWCLMLAQSLNKIGPSRLWVPLLGTVSHLKSALFHAICPARFTSYLNLLFSPGPWLGAPLSSYLEVTLYKFHRYIDRYMIQCDCPIIVVSWIQLLINTNFCNLLFFR